MVELNFKAGDKVRFRLSDRELDAVVLESPDSGIVLVKLESGYNIGIPKENILASRILKKFKEEEVKKEFNLNKELPLIGLVITGGTIASKVSQVTGGVKPITDANEFLHFYPELTKIVNIKKIEIPFKVFSENMNSEHWRKIAECTFKMLEDNEIQGVIISHGTDTLGYSAAALSFFLKELNKPVALTYSQKSIDRASSDASMNLQSAARFALSDCAEVAIVGHASTNDDYCYAIRGTKARKLHSSRRDAFQSINSEVLAKISDGVEFLTRYKKRDNKRKAVLDKSYSDKVALVKFYPGQDASILDYYALKCKGIVIEGTGLGHVADSWIPALRKHIRNGLVVCMASQTIFGRVDPYVYSTGRELEEAGVIFLEDMTSECALVKLGFILGHYGWKANAAEKMLENFAGEFSDKLGL